MHSRNSSKYKHGERPKISVCPSILFGFRSRRSPVQSFCAHGFLNLFHPNAACSGKRNAPHYSFHLLRFPTALGAPVLRRSISVTPLGFNPLCYYLASLFTIRLLALAPRASPSRAARLKYEPSHRPNPAPPGPSLTLSLRPGQSAMPVKSRKI